MEHSERGVIPSRTEDPLCSDRHLGFLFAICVYSYMDSSSPARPSHSTRGFSRRHAGPGWVAGLFVSSQQKSRSHRGRVAGIHHTVVQL